MTDHEIREAAINRLNAIQDRIRELTDEAAEIIQSVTDFEDAASRVIDAAKDFQLAIDEAKDFIVS